MRFPQTTEQWEMICQRQAEMMEVAPGTTDAGKRPSEANALAELIRNEAPALLALHIPIPPEQIMGAVHVLEGRKLASLFVEFGLSAFLAGYVWREMLREGAHEI